MLLPEPRLFVILQRYLDGEIEVDEAAPQILSCDLGSGFGVEDVPAEKQPRLMALFAKMGTLVQQHRPES